MTARLLPVDIFAVKKYGVERWREEFFWPVSDIQFHRISSVISNFFKEGICNEAEEIGEILTVQHGSLRYEYINFLHVIKIIETAKEKGTDILYSDNTWWYKNILEGKKIDTHFREICRENKPPLIKRIKEKAAAGIKSFTKTALYNAPNPMKLISSLGGQEITLISGSPGNFIKDYIRKTKETVFFTAQWDILFEEDLPELPSGLAESIRSYTNRTVLFVTGLAEKEGIRISNEHISHLTDITEKILMRTAKVFASMEVAVKDGKKKIHFLLCAPGNPAYRAFSVIVRKYGGEVTGFIHGGDLGILNWPFIMDTYIGIADKVVAYTEKSATLHKMAVNNCC